MDNSLLGVIIGGAIGGGIGITTALITNCHAKKRQDKMLKHDSEENTKRYLREICKEKIQAYKAILMNIESAKLEILNAIETNSKEKIVNVWKKFGSDCLPYLILVSEEIEKKLGEMMVEVLLSARTPGIGIEKYNEFNNILSKHTHPLIVAIRKEIASIELSFGNK